MKESKKKDKFIKKNGFTIIELLICISMVLTFSLFVLYGNKVGRSISLNNVTNEIASALHYASNLSENQNHSVIFRIIKKDNEYKYQIIEYGHKMNMENNIPKNIKILSRSDIQEIEDKSKHFEMGNRPITIEFNNMTATGSNSIILMDNSLKTFYKITVVPTSSRIHIYKFN